MPKIHIVIGSVTGRAEEVAAAMAGRLQATGFEVRLNTTFDATGWPGEDLLLVCTSNTGMGDLPANIVPFYRYITESFPAIAGLRYGIVNLGDSSYPNFAQAGGTLDDALADLGAVRVGEPLVLDAIYVDDHAAEAVAWVDEWVQLL